MQSNSLRQPERATVSRPTVPEALNELLSCARSTAEQRDWTRTATIEPANDHSLGPHGTNRHRTAYAFADDAIPAMM